MILPHASLRHGLVGAWCPSLGSTGYTLLDRSGRNNHGTLTNMGGQANWIASGGGLSVRCDGTNDYITTPYWDGLNDLRGSDKTICAWVRKSSQAPGYRTLVTRDQTLNMTTNSNVFGAYDWTAATFRSSGVNIGDDAWRHLVVQVRAGVTGGSKFFVNGAQAGSDFTYSVQPGNSNTQIGLWLCNAMASNNFVASEYSAANIDDVRIYSRALSQQEITLLASRRGIGLVPQRQRRTLPSTKRLSVRVGGVYKDATPYIRVGGVWKEAAAYRRDGTGWKN